MSYRGKALRMGSKGTAVRAVQKQLTGKGFPCAADGEFGPKTLAEVKDFQSRHTDTLGHPLVVDGVVGPLTWLALFGAGSVPAPKPASELGLAIVQEARHLLQAKVHEVPDGSNYGDGVTDLIDSVGLHGPMQWCQVTAWHCAWTACHLLKLGEPKKRWCAAQPSTCSTVRWAKTKGWYFSAKDVLNGNAHIEPGDFVYIYLDFGQWHGHVGIVESIGNGIVTTIEGNSDNRVRQLERRLSGLAGFVRLR